MKQEKKFDPFHYKKEGFLTRRSVNVFNSIWEDDMNAATRSKLIQVFVSECYSAI